MQAVLNIYETFHLSNGHTVKLPPDKGEGQHWQVKPGNLYSKPVKMHLDPKSPQTVRISLDQKIPALENELKDVDSVVGWSGANDDHAIVDNKWVKHIHVHSDLLTKFWGRPTELGAVILVPDGFDEHPDAHYPVIVDRITSIAICRGYSHSAHSSKRQLEGKRPSSREERIQALSGLDIGTSAASDRDLHPACDALLR